MQSKAERFELRLDEGTLTRVDDWRKKEGDIPSRSEAVRRLIETSLVKAQSPRLSDGEKLTLLMLCDLSKQLKVKSEIDPTFLEAVIFGGHYWGLRWRYGGLFHGHNDSDRMVKEVVDILDMWHFLETGFNRLSSDDKARVKDEAAPFGDRVAFPGFDGNNETEYGSIAVFLVEHLGRFSGFEERIQTNSHMPVLDGYRRMLTVFLPMRHELMGAELSVAQIIKVLKARRYRADSD